MVIIKHTVQTTAKPEAIWKILSDVCNWPTWDHATESSSINGPFASGAIGKLKPKDSPAELVILLTHVQPNESFDCEIKLFCARVVSYHTITQSDNKTVLTFRTDIKGPLAFLWALLIGRGIKKKIPVEMLALVKQAEALDKNRIDPGSLPGMTR